MKWLIASDIHGSAAYCEELLAQYKREGAQRLLLLGDILYHGPRNDLPSEYRPKSVISMLNEMKNEILCVKGNCDTEVDQMVLDFPIMAEYAVIPLGERVIFATHGHKFNIKCLPPIKRGDVLLHGHTHIPKCEKTSGILYCNPGSASIPKENCARGYMLLREDRLVWKSLDGEKLFEFFLDDIDSCDEKCFF